MQMMNRVERNRRRGPRSVMKPPQKLMKSLEISIKRAAVLSPSPYSVMNTLICGINRLINDAVSFAGPRGE